MKKFWNLNNIRSWFVSTETNTHIQCRKYVWIMSPIMNWKRNLQRYFITLYVKHTAGVNSEADASIWNQAITHPSTV